MAFPFLPTTALAVIPAGECSLVLALQRPLLAAMSCESHRYEMILHLSQLTLNSRVCVYTHVQMCITSCGRKTPSDKCSYCKRESWSMWQPRQGT